MIENVENIVDRYEINAEILSSEDAKQSLFRNYQEKTTEMFFFT